MKKKTRGPFDYRFEKNNDVMTIDWFSYRSGLGNHHKVERMLRAHQNWLKEWIGLVTMSSGLKGSAIIANAF